MKKVEIEIFLNLVTLEKLNKIAELADVTTEQVINVILATEMVKVQDGSKDQSENKRNNVSASKKSKLAKRKRSK